MAEFLHMGGYGAYVWSAFGLTALVLWWNLWQPMRVERDIKRELSAVVLDPKGAQRDPSA